VLRRRRNGRLALGARRLDMSSGSVPL
jgi:hypothetical protein